MFRKRFKKKVYYKTKLIFFFFCTGCIQINHSEKVGSGDPPQIVLARKINIIL